MLFVASDNEVSGNQARSAPRCSRRRSAGEADETCQEQSRFSRNNRFVGSDEDGGYPANIAASEASDQTQRAKQSNSAVVDCTLTGSRQFTSFVTRQQTLLSSRTTPAISCSRRNGCPS